MELFRIEGTGLKAVGLIIVSFAVWVMLTGPRFKTLCGDMEGVAKTITFDITSREMRRVVAGLQKKSWIDRMHADGDKIVNELSVSITELKCADTFVMGVVCRARYRIGSGDNAGPVQEDWFRMLRSGKSESWFDYLGPKKLLFSLSPRSCTRD